MNFKRIPCAMSSLYTGIIGGTLTATLALVSTGIEMAVCNECY